MSVEKLERLFVFLTSLPQKQIRTHWHGGEPLLAGKEFFNHIVRLQKQYPEKLWANAVQTNAMLVDEEWARFFRKHNFHLGVSVDGSERTHDTERINIAGQGTYKKVMNGVKILRHHDFQPSVICTVTKKTFRYAKEMLLGLVDSGFKEIAFNAFYNTASNFGEDTYGLTDRDWLVFLIEIFETWLSLNDPAVRVRELDAMLAWTKSKSSNLCSYKGMCHQWFVVDYTGEIYPCERLGRSVHFGGIDSLRTFDELSESQVFKDWKASTVELPSKCKSCDLQSYCHNGCVAHRKSDEDKTPHYTFCESRLGFYDYITKRLGGKEVKNHVASKQLSVGIS